MIEAVCRLLGRPRRAPKERSLIDELSEFCDRVIARSGFEPDVIWLPPRYMEAVREEATGGGFYGWAWPAIAATELAASPNLTEHAVAMMWDGRLLGVMTLGPLKGAQRG